MKKYKIPQSDIEVSRIAYGCMKLGRHWDATPITRQDIDAGQKVIQTACENGITLFDHADIYARGKSEEIFGQILHIEPELRERIIIQSKCSIRFAGEPEVTDPQRYDFTAEYIMSSVEGSLKRLQTDYLDILLLHRPDPLVEPEEVAKAFSALYTSGKVRVFGVSNHTASQIALLQHFVDQPIVINQVQLNLIHNYLIDEGVIANRSGVETALASDTLDYCRLHHILVQAYNPVGGGQLINPPEDAQANVKAAAGVIADFAQSYHTTREAVALSWLLRHPAGIQPIIGTTRPERIVAACAADVLELSREAWYTLYIAGRGHPLP
ncbi:MAG: aldo/keto reductase [Anaerolineales bacterium]|nr:MAG: aldo/keto reductase [Anaerolineales bacterium]